MKPNHNSNPDHNPRPVLCLHGSASSGKQWRGLVEALCHEREVYAPDLYRLKQSRHSNRFDAISELLLQVHEPVDIVAHSLGGAIALKLANCWPTHVRSLVLFDPVVPIRSASGEEGIPGELEGLWSEIHNGTDTTVMRYFMEYWGGPWAWKSLTDDQRERLTAYRSCLAQDAAEMDSGTWSVRHTIFGGAISLLRGADSPVVTNTICHHLIGAYPQASYQVLAGLNHFSPMIDADQVTRAVIECLGMHATGDATAHLRAVA